MTIPEACQLVLEAGRLIEQRGAQEEQELVDAES